MQTKCMQTRVLSPDSGSSNADKCKFMQNLFIIAVHPHNVSFHDTVLNFAADIDKYEVVYIADSIG